MVYEDENNVCQEHSIPYGELPFDTFPMESKKKDLEKCYLTCYVRKNDPEIDTFLEHRATSHVTKISSKKNLEKAKYLLPLVKGSMDGYYIIKSYELVNDKVHFELGEFSKMGENWIHVYGKMKPGELLDKAQCEELCK